VCYKIEVVFRLWEVRRRSFKRQLGANEALPLLPECRVTLYSTDKLLPELMSSGLDRVPSSVTSIPTN